MAGPSLAGPYADQVVNYSGGTGASAVYSDPQVALGEPSRLTPDPVYGTSVVSMVSAPYLGTQIVQLGSGGSLTVKFNEPIANNPANPYGADLIVFGNSFFAASWPDGTLNSPPTLWGDGQGKIEVSSDGVSFFEIPGVLADRLFPTQGYLDAGPFDGAPGLVPTDFRKPMDPALTLADFDGLSFSQALALYAGSGGGAPVDIAAAVNSLGQPAALGSISYVRVTNASATPLEIDAFAAVPEPVSAGLLLPILMAVVCRRRWRY